MFLDARNPDHYKQVMNVKSVYVDNKKIAMPVAFNAEEGWCDGYVPMVPDAELSQKVVESEEFEFDVHRYYGDVKIVWKDNEE